MFYYISSMIRGKNLGEISFTTLTKAFLAFSLLPSSRDLSPEVTISLISFDSCAWNLLIGNFLINLAIPKATYDLIGYYVMTLDWEEAL